MGGVKKMRRAGVYRCMLIRKFAASNLVNINLAVNIHLAVSGRTVYSIHNLAYIQ